jgi:hypothetical protein
MNSGYAGTETNLVAYYKFDQGEPCGNNINETALIDKTTNAINGTLNNFTLNGSFMSNWAASDIITNNNALHFDGVDDWAAVPAVTSGAITEFTIETWLNIDNLTASGINALFNTNTSGNYDLHYQFSNGKLSLWSMANNPASTYLNYSFEYGKWYHIATTYSSISKQIIFYVNGKRISTNTLTTATALSTTLAPQILTTEKNKTINETMLFILVSPIVSRLWRT